MLDAFIIDRIRRERERREREREDGAFIPLQIDEPRGPVPSQDEEEDDRPKRGSVVIDFHV